MSYDLQNFINRIDNHRGRGPIPLTVNVSAISINAGEIDLTDITFKRLIFVKYDVEVNLALMQRLADLCNDIVITDYDGYELPNFGNKNISFSFNFKPNLENYRALPQCNNFALNIQNRIMHKNHYYDVLHESPIKQANIFIRIEYNALPELKKLKTIVYEDTWAKLVEYSRKYPDTIISLQLCTENHPINLSEVNNISEITCIITTDSWRYIAEQCARIEYPFKLRFYLRPISNEECDQFAEIVKDIMITPVCLSTGNEYLRDRLNDNLRRISSKRIKLARA